MYFHEKDLLNAAFKRDGTSGSVALRFTPAPLDDDPDAERFKTFVGGGLANNQLVIETGADEITWGYGMNVTRTPTYGGEVVQILSMYADKLVIKGVCQHYGKQRQIYQFFQRYMGYVSGASGKKRRQGYLQFTYEPRNWDFLIMVTEAPDMTLATDIAAPEWRIAAEIVSENDRYSLGQSRHDQMASVLNKVTNQSAQARRGRRSAGLPATAEVTETTSSGRIKNFRVKRRTDPFGDPTDFLDGKRGKIAENFEALTASWITGTIETLRYNPLVAPEQSASEIYASKFGTDIAIGPGAGGGGGSVGPGADASGASALTGQLKPEVVAALAAMAFREIGTKYPDSGLKALAKSKEDLRKAVGISYKESTWTVEAIHHNVDGPNDPPNPTLSEFTSGPSTTVPKSENTKQGNYDLGLWQINNYWHPGEIARACGYTGNDVPEFSVNGNMSPPAEGDAWKKVVNIIIKNDYYHQMCIDALANARAMAYIYADSHWDSWTTNGQGIDSGAVTQINNAVDKYLADPEKYENQVLGTGNVFGGPLTKDGKEAIAKLQKHIKSGKLIVDHDNDKKAIMDGTGIVQGRESLGYASDKITLDNRVLTCLVYLVENCGFTSVRVSCLVGSHHQDTYDHWYGKGIDVWAINGNDLKNKMTKQITINALKALWNMGPGNRPEMTIMGGNGAIDTDVQAWEWLLPYDRGPLWDDAASDNSSHTDHIHIGYGKR